MSQDRQKPVLKRALRRLWRDATTLQLGVDPDRAVVLTGLGPGHARLLEGLDGRSDREELRRRGALLGLSGSSVDQLIDLLERSEVLEDPGDVGGRCLDGVGDDAARLGPDGAAASLARWSARNGAEVLERRGRSLVHVHGAGRVGAAVASLLAAAGIGAVIVDDAEPAGPADLSPAGIGRGGLGMPREMATVRALHEVSAGVRTRPRRPPRPADLAVVTSDGPRADVRLGQELMRRGVPHLYAVVRETTGVVGPLVLPGQSSCLRCHDLHRGDRDRGWPTVAAQLASSAGPDPVTACDVVLATAVAAHAGLQALAFVDEGALPPAVDGTIEISQVDGRVRRRSWVAHPACGCMWASETGVWEETEREAADCAVGDGQVAG